MPPEMLEAAFEPVVGREVEVINYGQGAYIMNQERITLLLHGMKVKPDLLLTLNGANDIVTTSKTLRPGIAYANDFVALGVNRPVFNGLLGLIRNSQFVNCVNKLRERSVEGKAQENDALLGETIDHCEEALTSMAQIAKGMDIPHLMVLQPYIHLRNNLSDEEKAVAKIYAYRGTYTAKGFRALRERMTATEFPGQVHVIDATKAFDQTEEICFIDEVHLTEAGNRAMIDYIAQQAAQQGLTKNLVAN